MSGCVQAVLLKSQGTQSAVLGVSRWSAAFCAPTDEMRPQSSRAANAGRCDRQVAAVCFISELDSGMEPKFESLKEVHLSLSPRVQSRSTSIATICKADTSSCS